MTTKIPSSMLTGVPTSAITVRQTVLGGPVDSSGLPSFLPSTSASLSLTSQNISSTVPFVVAAANGFGATGNVDLIGISTSNLTWSSLTGSSTCYLYVDVSSTGTLTTGHTTLAPTYQFGGTRSTTNNQFTFNIQEMYASVGNGSSAVQTYRVYVGECTTTTTVTATVAYAYQGRYDSGWTNTLPSAGSTTTKNHNIGCVEPVANFLIKNLTTDQGYAVGDIVTGITAWSTYGGVVPIFNTSLTANVKAAANGTGWALGNKSTGTQGTLTAANWAYKVTAQRGW